MMALNLVDMVCMKIYRRGSCGEIEALDSHAPSLSSVVWTAPGAPDHFLGLCMYMKNFVFLSGANALLTPAFF